MDIASSSSGNNIERCGVFEYSPGNGDDSWYLVSVTILRDGKLGIHYKRSTDHKRSDDVLDLADFKSPEDLYARFRYPSTQIKDKHCRKVRVHFPLLIAHRTGIANVARYFDARVDEVRLHFYVSFLDIR